MRTLISLCFIFMLFVSANAEQLSVSVYPAQFFDGEKEYVEIHYYYSGHTIGWQQVADSTMQASVEVTILFKQGEKIVKFDKYNLSSPILPRPADFRDVHRYSLHPGTYDMTIKVVDNSRLTNTVSFASEIIILPKDSKPRVSDIVLLQSLQQSDEQTAFTKYGYHMEALPYNYIDKNQSKIFIYAETYNSHQLNSDNYNLRMQLQKVNDLGERTPYQAVSFKRDRSAIDVFIKPLDVQFMETGKYNLILEMRGTDGTVITQNVVSFYRDNPRYQTSQSMTDLHAIKGEFIEQLSEDEVDYGLTALIPVLSGSDSRLVNSYFKNNNTEAKRQFLYAYFSDKRPNNPQQAFEEYLDIARRVDKEFYSGFGYGFESDRGAIFLKYGSPNDQIRVEDEAFAFPYEIWVYEQLQGNSAGPVKFLFYNPDRTGENYSLLHSNAKGERRNPNWKNELFRNDSLRSFDSRNDRIKESEKDNAYGAHPNSMAIRYFQDL